MKIGIAGANVGPFAEGTHALALARGAEAAGVESLWAYQHVVVPSGYDSRYPYSASGRMASDDIAITDPLGWIAFLAGGTENLRFGTGVLILPEHNPVMLAKLSATVDRLAEGRLMLGIGVGWLKEEFTALGVPWTRRTARAEEYVDVMRRLWREAETSFAGEFVHLERARCVPKPARPAGIPIIVGGHSDAAAARAGRIGDGFYPAAAPERVAELVPIMRESADRAGRDPDAIEITAGAGPRPDHDTLSRYEELGVSRVMVRLPSLDPAQLPRALDELHRGLLAEVA